MLYQGAPDETCFVLAAPGALGQITMSHQQRPEELLNTMCCVSAHFLVFSFLSRALACCSLMMVALTCGGFMCTFSLPPTSKRTVAANLVCVFST